MFTQLYGLQGQRAIVTGAAKGIGKAIAEALAQHGACVMLADVDPAVHALAESLSTAQTPCLSKIADVRQESDVVDLVRTTEEQLGAVDILVNNAGIFPLRPIAEMTAEIWDEVHAVNLRGAMLATREAARAIGSHGRGGAIVNISSVGSLNPKLIGLTAYNATKAGLNMLTKSAALEFAPAKIRVNAVLPGPIGTEDILSNMGDGDYMERSRAKIPLKRLGDPSDVAHLVCFLCSQASAFMTGELIVLDGGVSLIG